MKKNKIKNEKKQIKNEKKNKIIFLTDIKTKHKIFNNKNIKIIIFYEKR
jgi:hypothetical protein